jgi:septum site-determining protein MinD
MVKLCNDLREMHDYVLIDCPAGIEQGFKNAIAGADRAIVVTTPEVSAVRDADRIIGLLEAAEVNDPQLIVNRIRPDMVRRGEMMDLEDMKDILAIDVIGIVPDDENVVISTNRGVPTVSDDESFSGQAFRNISMRITGQEVPLMDLDVDKSMMGKLKRLFGFGK